MQSKWISSMICYWIHLLIIDVEKNKAYQVNISYLLTLENRNHPEI
jgi:hypothetical protein